MISEALTRKLDTLPDGPGVYLWRDEAGELLYVGKAKNLRSRVRSYFATDFPDSPKHRLLQRRIADVETIVVNSESQSLLLENNLIKEYQPRFNVRLKDDKSYPSIVVTLGEPFPRVLATRLRDHRKGRYYGPYTDVADMRRTLGLVRRMFTVRSCADNLPSERRERPCLDYHIGRCKAPCVAWQTEASYRAMIGEVIEFLDGKRGDIKSRVHEMMLAASAREDFERAKDLRDSLRWLDQVETPITTVDVVGTGDADIIGYARDGDDAVGALLRVRDGKVVGREHRFLENVDDVPDEDALSALMVQWYVPIAGKSRRLMLPFAPTAAEGIDALLAGAQLSIPQRGVGARWIDLADQNARHLMESLRIENFETEERVEDPVYLLGRELGMTIVPRTFICIDISTAQGKDTVGSLVTFEAGRPKKSEYRKFKIEGDAQQDDYAAIHQVVTRYFTRRREEAKPLPDLVVIDGGKGQLGAAQEALTALGLEQLPLASLAKRNEEIFTPGRGEPIRLPRRSAALRLLQRARDEAHRFGVTYNRKRRTQRTVTSALLEIPGIGPTKRRLLLRTFGSLAGVKAATQEEIVALPGFSVASAQKLIEALKGI